MIKLDFLARGRDPATKNRVTGVISCINPQSLFYFFEVALSLWAHCPGLG